MQTIDFKKDQTYKAKQNPEIIKVPPMTFVMVDGHGAPEDKSGKPTEFQEAFNIIYGIVYTIKFWDKKYTAPPGYAKFTMPPDKALVSGKLSAQSFVVFCTVAIVTSAIGLVLFKRRDISV